MRHSDKVNNLGRTQSHRKALLKNLASNLIMHKRIVTTLAKAKALRIGVEPLLTKSKCNTTHSRRTVFSYLQNKEAVRELFEIVAAKIMHRNGGYTRIIKLGTRLGDNAELAMIELVDYNETYTTNRKQIAKEKVSSQEMEKGVHVVPKQAAVIKKTRRSTSGTKITQDVAKAKKTTAEIKKTSSSSEKSPPALFDNPSVPLEEK